MVIDNLEYPNIYYEKLEEAGAKIYPISLKQEENYKCFCAIMKCAEIGFRLPPTDNFYVYIPDAYPVSHQSDEEIRNCIESIYKHQNKTDDVCNVYIQRGCANYLGRTFSIMQKYFTKVAKVKNIVMEKTNSLMVTCSEEYKWSTYFEIRKLIIDEHKFLLDTIVRFAKELESCLSRPYKEFLNDYDFCNIAIDYESSKLYDVMNKSS